jgi:hypothetical protein
MMTINAGIFERQVILTTRKSRNLEEADVANFQVVYVYFYFGELSIIFVFYLN